MGSIYTFSSVTQVIYNTETAKVDLGLEVLS